MTFLGTDLGTDTALDPIRIWMRIRSLSHTIAYLALEDIQKFLGGLVNILEPHPHRFCVMLLITLCRRLLTV
jgi:hypothetical protein